MKSLEECNYYELLEIEPDAPKTAVEEAYRNVVELFGGDSMVSYSFLSGQERDEILERLREAYETLSDDARRRAYDRRTLGRIGRWEPPEVPAAPASGPEPSPAALRILEFLDAQGRVLLERLREARGVSLEAVSRATRIRLPVLQALEARDLGRLPAAVYVKGHLTAYAGFLGIDPRELIRTYGPPISAL